MAVAISTVFLIAIIRLDTPKISTEDETLLPQKTRQTSSRQEEPLFILKEYNGCIGVFKEGEKEPSRVLEDVVVKSLPEYDRKLLKTGIKVYSLWELQDLIEDYDG